MNVCRFEVDKDIENEKLKTKILFLESTVKNLEKQIDDKLVKEKGEIFSITLCITKVYKSLYKVLLLFDIKAMSP